MEEKTLYESKPNGKVVVAWVFTKLLLYAVFYGFIFGFIFAGGGMKDFALSGAAIFSII